MEVKPSAQSSSQKENFVNTSKSLVENRNWTFSIVHYFTWKLNFFSNILSVIVSAKRFFPSILPEVLSNLISLTILVTLKYLTEFQRQIRVTNFWKVLQFALHDNYFFDLFIEVQIWYCKTFKFGLGHCFRKIK